MLGSSTAHVADARKSKSMTSRKRMPRWRHSTTNHLGDPLASSAASHPRSTDHRARPLEQGLALEVRHLKVRVVIGADLGPRTPPSVFEEVRDLDAQHKTFDVNLRYSCIDTTAQAAHQHTRRRTTQASNATTQEGAPPPNKADASPHSTTREGAPHPSSRVITH